MRLSTQEQTKIVAAISLFITDKYAALYLYGSRVDDALKGGDIDLLLVTYDARKLALSKHQILTKIKELIGDQRIDLKIATKTQTKTDPFLQLILPSAILLQQWNN